MGHDSHGVIRVPEYLGFVADGSIVVDAPLRVERTGPTTAVVDCGRALERSVPSGPFAKELRSRGTHGVCDHEALQSCRPAGGLGQLAADEGMLASPTCHSPIHGHQVLPWGGARWTIGDEPDRLRSPDGR